MFLYNTYRFHDAAIGSRDQFNSDMLIATVPNLVRAGDTETVLVTIQKDNIGVARSVPVTVSFKNADHSLIGEETINIQEGGSRVNSETAHVYVNPEKIPDLEAKDGVARYITVTVTCNLMGFSQDKRVLLSLEGGYVFIQTDKPIYTPANTGKGLKKQQHCCVNVMDVPFGKLRSRRMSYDYVVLPSFNKGLINGLACVNALIM
ncbi:complement component 3-2 [Apostichopus japonicus]|uniref:Complement component 3-2 n=1 Tax=Stichopus japonicus TaxID=307972 RepID=A0A2G8JVY5_STIJA|nr:complement component 3-2 [Apostichopus japonicus]